jgi:hypothetical protein
MNLIEQILKPIETRQKNNNDVVINHESIENKRKKEKYVVANGNGSGNEILIATINSNDELCINNNNYKYTIIDGVNNKLPDNCNDTMAINNNIYKYTINNNVILLQSTGEQIDIILIENKPYKNILKNEDYSRVIKFGDDLVVHKVSDKDKEGVIEALDKLKKDNNEIDIQNKVEYAPEKYNEHKKNFEYKKTYVSRLKHDAPGHGELKDDGIEFYKKEQEELEKGKNLRDDILKELVTNGLFNENEIPDELLN